MYLPQPRSGGRVSTKESSHIIVIILKASWYDDTFPLIRPAYKKFFILAIDNTQRVIIDAKPKTKFAHMVTIESDCKHRQQYTYQLKHI